MKRQAFVGAGVLAALSMAAAAELNFPRVVLDEAYVAYERDVGDVDGDGRNDVVAVGDGGSSVQWFRAPDWTRATLCTLTGVYAYTRADDFKVADVDGDADVDLVVRLGAGPTDDGEGRAAWIENLGQGTGWVTRIVGTSPTYGKDIAVGDLDGDGRLDLVYREDSLTQIWFNETNGWTEVRLDHVPHEGMELGDLDMDGDLDVVLNGFWFATPDAPAACRAASNYVYQSIDPLWYEQTGDWTANSCKVAVGDVDGDGTNDVVFSQSERAGYAVTWYRREGASWTAHPVAIVDYAHTLQVYDADLDGDVDVLTGGMVQSAHKGLRLFLNDGAGDGWSTNVVQSDGSYSAELGDIDNDGDLDVVGIVNWNAAPSYIYRSNAGGPPSLDFWKYVRASDQHERTFGLAFADVDGDGDLDVASGRYLYRNPGGDLEGTWIQTAVDAGIHLFQAMDVDGDDRADLIALQRNAGPDRIDLFWYEALDPAGTGWTQVVKFGDVPVSEHAEGFQGSRVAQIVSGGAPELLISSAQGPCWFSIPANPEAGSWPRTWIADNDSDEGLGVADFDADGHLDVAFTAGGSKQVKWARNPGDGSGDWAVHVVGSFPEADWPDRCEAVDVDGDGRPDVVVTEENAGGSPDALCCWWEQPEGSPTNADWTRRTVTTRYTLNSMDSGDVDRDGDVDLVLAEHRGDERIGVFANDGSGGFSEFPVGEGEENHLGARLADLDGDGDLDLVGIAYDDYVRLHVWRNDSPAGIATVARPVVSPNGGIFDESVAVSIACGTPDAEIWYSLDGQTPTNAAPFAPYTNGPFVVATTTTVKARAFKADHAPSPVATATFTGPQVQTPVFAPPGGVFADTQEVAISCATAGATIRYTTDGSPPTESSEAYAAPLELAATTTLRARAYRDGTAPSLEATAMFTRFTRGAVAHWRFDERFGPVAYDASGFGRTGTLHGAVRVAGTKDRALSFDGVDSRVEVGDWNVAGTGLTLCAWARLASPYADNDARLLSKAVGSAEQDHVWMLSATMVGAEIRPRFRLKTSGTTSTLIGDSGHFVLGTWHHVAAVYDGAAMKLFLDGSPAGTLAKSGEIDGGTAGIFVGANPPSAYAAWYGDLDDVRVYNVPLSSEEIAAVMAETPEPAPPVLGGYQEEGGQFTLFANGIPGRYLALEHTTDLVTGAWTFISSNEVWTSNLVLSNTPPSKQGAYRLRLD